MTAVQAERWKTQRSGNLRYAAIQSYFVRFVEGSLRAHLWCDLNIGPMVSSGTLGIAFLKAQPTNKASR